MTTPTAQRDYYGLLGVAPAATDDDLRHAYRRLAKLWHPDRYVRAPDELRQRAERRMRLLTEAYGVVGDPVRRAAYDRERGIGLPGAAAGAGSAPLGGVPFEAPRVGVGIPGYGHPASLSPTAADENGLGVFFGLIFAVIALLGAANISPGNANPGLGTILALAALVGGGILAALCFANRGPILRVARAPLPPHLDLDNWRDLPLAERAPEELTPFEEAVRQALAGLPPEFASELRNTAVFVQDEPDMATLRRVGVRPGWTLFGLYEGVPATRQGLWGLGAPERITLFQGPIERHCRYVPSRVVHQIRATLLHELAHHFGLDHDDMPIWVKA